MPVSAASEAARELSRLGVAARQAKMHRRLLDEAVERCIAEAPNMTARQAARLREIFAI